MTCERWGKLLALQQEGALSSRDACRVAEHLEGCGRCRALQRELVQSRHWIESAPAPIFAEEDFAAVRRGVWREIQARRLHSRRGASTARNRAFAAAGLAAAVLGVIWLARRAPEPALERLASPAAAPHAASLPAPSSAGASGRPAAPAVASVVSAPAARVARAARRRRAALGEAAFSRIEFRTANPNVRVIWLVEKGRKDSSAPMAGRKQEVS
jgi:hypothetical protein